MAVRVGFIGLGAMGFPMASNLLSHGFDVIAYDIDPGKLDPLIARGARAGSSVAETARDAEFVVTMLPATAHVEEVILGPDGVLDNVAPGAVVIDMSTVDPDLTDRLATNCTMRGASFADCPVGRPVSFAERGQALFMVGADDATFARTEPLLKAMGDTIFHCGRPGTGIRMKIVNNFVVLATAQVVAEGLTLGTKLGLDIENMRDVTAATTARNGQFHMLFVNKVLKGDIEPGFTIDLAFKDLTLAMQIAAELRLGLPLGSSALAVFGGARTTHYAQKDFSALLMLACDQAGIKAPRLPD